MSLAKLKQKIDQQKGRASEAVNTAAPAKGIGEMKRVTPVQLKTPMPPTPQTPPKKAAPVKALPKITPGQAEALIRGCGSVLSEPIPQGYTHLGKHDTEKLMWFKAETIKAEICGFDYETDGDPDDDTTDPQDHMLVGVSFAYKVGMAVYLPIAHDNYGANWDLPWLVESFLKPVLEHPDVLVIAHNIKFEHQVSLLHGINMFPKTENRKVMDTMMLVKGLALPECTQQTSDGFEVIVGLKPSTKALLADRNGMVHGLLHVDDIKSFGDTVGRVKWEEPIPGEFFKSGKNKGLPKTTKHSKSRTFNELPVDKTTVDYGCSDSDWALALFLKLMPMAEAEGIADVIWELDVPNMMATGEIELSGWHIDPQRLEDMRKIADTALKGDKSASEGSDEWRGLEDRLKEALLDIAYDYYEEVDDDTGMPIVPAGRYEMGTWRGDDVWLKIATPKPFSWGSNQHLPWLFYHVLKVDTRGLERSKTTGIPGTGKDNMAKIIDEFEGDNQFMKILKEKKKYDKILSTYVEGMLPFCRQDTQKLHTNLNLVSTWRYGSKKPNLQNIPRPENDPMGIRGVFEAPSYDPEADYSHLNTFTRPTEIILHGHMHPLTEHIAKPRFGSMVNTGRLSGHTFYIGSDYSQIELKVLAWYAGEQTMIQTLANGGDLHAAVARDVFKLDCTVEEVKDRYKPFRYRAKKVNFGLVYGMTEYGLSKDRGMGMTVEQAAKFIEDYMATFPGVREYAKSMIAFAREHGYVETIFGHRRPIPEINHPSKWVRQKGDNKAMNTPIQGSASDIIRLAMVNIRKEAPKRAPYIRMVMQIHDEIQVECPVEYAVEGALFVKEVMERHIEGFSDVMPIVAEPAIGKIWQHALDIKFDNSGNPYVKAKTERQEATDVLIDEIQYALPLYNLAGIEVRV